MALSKADEKWLNDEIRLADSWGNATFGELRQITKKLLDDRDRLRAEIAKAREAYIEVKDGEWSLVTMQMVNALTQDIKDKALHPGWFLLRQRFEQVENAIATFRAQLAEANAARERAEAKCAEMTTDYLAYAELLHMNNLHGYDFANCAVPMCQHAIALANKDNPGQPLLDLLRRVEALIEKWRKDGKLASMFADELEQALKGGPHA